MAEVLGIGCTHAPMILNPPEQWVNIRKRLASTVPNYQAPPKLIEELGDDNGVSQDRKNHKRIVDAFQVLSDKLHSFKPDVVIVVGDDQAEWHIIMATTMLAMLPPAVVVMLMQRQFVKGLVETEK